MASVCGADVLANGISEVLTKDQNFEIPDVDLTSSEFQVPDLTGMFPEVTKLTNEHLTSRTVGGSGTFDAIMASMGAHLQNEYSSGRITGNEYTKAFIGVTTAALSAGVQYLLGMDQAYWQAIGARQAAIQSQIQLVTARVGLETAKAQLSLAKIQAEGAESEYALTKMKLATEDAAYCLALVQKSGAELDNQTKNYSLANILPLQSRMLSEQVEVQRAQTLDSRTDGQVVRGSVGKQKELYDQQIISYKRDSEIKAAKIFSDAWITQKTIDEGLLAPTQFTNDMINTVLTAIKLNNNLT